MPVDSVVMMVRRIWLIATITLLVAACGDDDDSSTSASTTPVTTTSTTTVPATAAATTVPRTTAPPTTSVATTLALSCSDSPPFDPNGSLRDQFVTYLVSCGFSQSEAACLFEHLDFADPAVVAGDPDAMLPAFETCNIDANRMAEIGHESTTDGGP